MQDSSGYIWFSTDFGLCRYDGGNVKVYADSKGIPEKSCYGICEYPKGKLWFITSKNRLLYYDKKEDRLIEGNYGKALTSLVERNKLQRFYLLKPGKDNCLWIAAHSASYSVNMKTNAVTDVSVHDETVYHFLESDLSLLPVSVSDVFRLFNISEKNNSIQLCIHNPEKVIHTSFIWNSKSAPQWQSCTAKGKDGTLYIGWNTKLIKIHPDNTLETFTAKKRILSLYTGTDNDLYVGTQKGGLLYFRDSDLSDPVVSLADMSVSGICEDREGSLWCSTLERGIYYCKNNKLLSYSNVDGLDKKAEFLKSFHDTVFYTSSPNKLTRFNGKKFSSFDIDANDGFCIRDIDPYKGGYIVCQQQVIYTTDINFRKRVIIRAKDYDLNFGAKLAQLSGSGDVYFIQNNEFMVLINGKVKRLALLPHCNSFLIRENIFFFGCRDGVYSMASPGGPLHKISTLNSPVIAMAEGLNDTIYVATRNNGVYILKNQELSPYLNPFILSGVRLFDLCCDNYNQVWLGSNKGIFKIGRNKVITQYEMSDGLPSDEVYKISCTKDRVYFSTIEGLAGFATGTRLSSDVLPRLQLSSISINGTRLATDSLSLLSYKDNSLTLSFDILNFRNTNDPKLLYVIRNGSTYDSRIINGRDINLMNLSSGAYELKVYAFNEHGIKSMPVELRFVIEAPVWKQWWFIILCLLIAFFAGFLLVRWIIVRARRKEEDKSRINLLLAEFRMTALQSQMNPHFIFNAINSIQRYILERSKQEAYTYLAKFSTLIRMVLNNSEEKILPLHKELEMIKLYVELEQMRFNNRFKFKLYIADDVDTYKLNIPGMLVQPYIENAIWHGLMNLGKEDTGILNLSITVNDLLLKIVVEDNGIGRKKAADYKSEQVHKPVAMSLIEQRLSLMNKMQDSDQAKVLINDLYDEFGNACGTRIEIFLPIPNEN
jgi:hypothetical protein